MTAWQVTIGDYVPGEGGFQSVHTIGPGQPCQVGPGPVVTSRGQLRKNDTPRPLRHGVIARRPDLRGALLVDVPVTIYNTLGGADAEESLDELLGAWQERPSGYPSWLYVTDPADREYAYRGKPRRNVKPDEKYVRGGVIVVEMTFEATDPHRYSQDVHTDSSTGGAPGPGISFPFEFPFEFGGVPGTVGSGIANAGNASTWPLIVLEPTAGSPGPWTVRDLSRQLTFVYDAPIPVGQQVLVDMGEAVCWQVPASFSAFDVPVEPVPANAQLVTANVRRPDSSWIDFPPGDTTLTVSVAGGSGEVHAYWRDAWIR